MRHLTGFLLLLLLLLPENGSAGDELSALRAANAELRSQLQTAERQLAQCRRTCTANARVRITLHVFACLDPRTQHIIVLPVPQEKSWHSIEYKMPDVRADGHTPRIFDSATVPLRNALLRQFPSEAMRGELHILGYENPEVGRGNLSSCRRMDTLLLSANQKMDGRCLAVLRSVEGENEVAAWATDGFHIPYRLTTKRGWQQIINQPSPGTDVYRKWEGERLLERAFASNPNALEQLIPHIDDLPVPKDLHRLPLDELMYVTRPADLSIRVHVSDFGKPTVFWPDPAFSTQRYADYLPLLSNLGPLVAKVSALLSTVDSSSFDQRLTPPPSMIAPSQPGTPGTGGGDGGGGGASVRRPCLVMAANSGHLPLLFNFLCGLRQRGLALTPCHIVFATSAAVADRLRALGVRVFYDASGSLKAKGARFEEGAAKAYGDDIFGSMMWLKSLSTFLVLHAGFDVVFQDVDVTWLRDPVPMLHSLSHRWGADTLWMDDGGVISRFAPFMANSGFFYVRRNHKTLQLWDEVLFHSAYADKWKSNQMVINMVLERYHQRWGLQAMILPWRVFLSGKHIPEDYQRLISQSAPSAHQHDRPHDDGHGHHPRRRHRRRLWGIRSPFGSDGKLVSSKRARVADDSAGRFAATELDETNVLGKGDSGAVAVLHFCWTSDLTAKVAKMRATDQLYLKVDCVRKGGEHPHMCDAEELRQCHVVREVQQAQGTGQPARPIRKPKRRQRRRKRRRRRVSTGPPPTGGAR